MQHFTTRPEIQGTFGVVTTTHWLASAVGMKMLEAGGNAFDAATAAGFVLHVVEPHLNGPGGDISTIIHEVKSSQTKVICGQGTAPNAATIEHYTAEGLEVIPGNGLLATVIPGAFDAWMLLMRDFGTLPLRQILEPAIHYAESGHPVLPRVCETISDLQEFFQDEWPTSHRTWLPNGNPPQPGDLIKLPVLAETWTKLLKEAEQVRGREEQFEAAREVFYKGFIADEIDKFLECTEVLDASGDRHKGVLTAADMASWKSTLEEPTAMNYHGWNVTKTGPWGQGPVLLQSLALLEGFNLADLGPTEAEFVHLTIEAMKFAFADREVYYGDPKFVQVPLDQLLGNDYNQKRRQLINNKCSYDLQPGQIDGFSSQLSETLKLIEEMGTSDSGVYEPTMAHLSERKGDTVHIDAIDRFGNIIATTPSGGWLQSSPTIPGLGFCLNSRAQMFWLTEGLPSSLKPGKRPRTTLTPTIAIHEDGTSLALGSPGGDQQDQWQLLLFLRLVHHDLNLQEAIDLPLFHTTHFPSSFYPRQRQPGHIMVERNIGSDVIADLQSRGHTVEVSDNWTVGRLTAAKRESNGILKAAATPRMMQAYAIGR